MRKNEIGAFYGLIALLFLYITSYGILRASGICVYRVTWNNIVDDSRMLQNTDVSYEGFSFSFVSGQALTKKFYYPLMLIELQLRPEPRPLPLYKGYSRAP